MEIPCDIPHNHSFGTVAFDTDLASEEFSTGVWQTGLHVRSITGALRDDEQL